MSRGTFLQHTSGHQFKTVDEYEEQEVTKVNNPFAPHHCPEMKVYAETNRRTYGLHRWYAICYEKGKWHLYIKEQKGMEIVQCPFCHQRMFVGNQVTIE